MMAQYRFFSLLIGAALLVAPTAHALGNIETAAVVNDQLITSLDVDERVLLLLTTTDLPNTEEQRAKLRPQVLRMLVEEQLQMQEASRLTLNIKDEDLAKAIKNIEEQSKREPGSLENYVRSRGVPLRTFYQQIRAQVAWSKILMRQIRPKVNVTDEEVIRETARQAAKSGGQDINISTLTLPIDSTMKVEDIQALAKTLMKKMQAGTPIATLAQQLGGNQASNAENLWVPLKDAEPSLASALKDAQAGAVIGPIKTPVGIQIVQVNDRRASADQTSQKPIEIVLKQILFGMGANASSAEVDATLAIAQQVQENPGTCMDESVADIKDLKDMQIKVNFLRTLLQQLPEQLRGMVMDMNVGTVSDPISTPEGVVLVVLCERIEKPDGQVMDDAVRKRLLQEKLLRESARYMRDLRTNATIDIR